MKLFKNRERYIVATEVNEDEKRVMTNNLKRVSKMDMKLYTSPADYLEAKGWITKEQILFIYKNFQAQNMIHQRESIQFELTAYNYGFLTEEQLVDCVVGFRSLDVVRLHEFENMAPVFNTFNYGFCETNHCFEYLYKNGKKSDTPMIIISLANQDIVNTIKRQIESFRVRYSIPAYVDSFIDENNPDPNKRKNNKAVVLDSMKEVDVKEEEVIYSFKKSEAIEKAKKEAEEKAQKLKDEKIKKELEEEKKAKLAAREQKRLEKEEAERVRKEIEKEEKLKKMNEEKRRKVKERAEEKAKLEEAERIYQEELRKGTNLDSLRKVDKASLVAPAPAIKIEPEKKPVNTKKVKKK